MIRILLILGLLGILGMAAPVAAQKDRPPATPVPAQMAEKPTVAPPPEKPTVAPPPEPTKAPPPPTPEPKPTVAPPVKPTDLPTPTPTPPKAPSAPTPTVVKSPAPPTPTSAPARAATTALTGTVTATLVSHAGAPYAAPPGAPAAPGVADTDFALPGSGAPVTVLTHTTVITQPHPVQVIVQQVQTQIAALPAWVLVAGALLLLLAGYLIGRWLYYTRRDLHLKERQIGEDAAARLTAHRREVEARLGEPNAWRLLTAQIIGDALHVPVRLNEAPPTLNAELGYFSVVAVTGAEYQLTISAERQRRLKLVADTDRIISLPASETQLELHAIWTHLAAEWLPGAAPVLPRQTPWQLIARGK